MTTETILRIDPHAGPLLSDRSLTERFWRVTCLLLAIVVLWAVGLLCVYSLQNARQANASAELSQNIRFETDNLLLLLRKSETYQRGYLLTGNDNFRDSYVRALNLVPLSIGRLRKLTAGSQISSVASTSLSH